MKKLIVLVMLSISIFSFSQDKQVLKLSLINNTNTHNCMVGFDIGTVIDNKHYLMMDVSVPLNRDGSGYLNLGVGRMLNESVYIAGLFGIYNESSTNLIQPDGGMEFGLINKRIVTSMFILFTTGKPLVGIKIGYIIRE